MKKIDSMNLVPFIDVMLVLLVIVLTTASFVNTSRIQVNVPKISDSSNKNQEINNKPLNIAIDSNGNFFLENKPITLDSLKTTLQGYDKQTPIILNGDSKSNLNSFVQIMDLLQDEGLNDLYIVVEEERQFGYYDEMTLYFKILASSYTLIYSINIIDIVS